MTEAQASELSDFERRVVKVIQEHSPEWVSFEQICAETMISPDIVMRIALELAQRKLIRTNQDAAPSEIQVTQVEPVT